MIILPQDLNIKDYHAYNAITSSKLRQFIKSPETYKDRLNGTHPDCHKTGGRHYIIGQVFEDMITLSTEELQQRSKAMVLIICSAKAGTTRGLERGLFASITSLPWPSKWRR